LSRDNTINAHQLRRELQFVIKMLPVGREARVRTTVREAPYSGGALEADSLDGREARVSTTVREAPYSGGALEADVCMYIAGEGPNRPQHRDLEADSLDDRLTYG
jgi:hypothetical protein